MRALMTIMAVLMSLLAGVVIYAAGTEGKIEKEFKRFGLSFQDYECDCVCDREVQK